MEVSESFPNFAAQRFSMHNSQYYIELLRQFKSQFAKQYGIRSIGIFGSVARGEQRPDSDLDVFIDVEDPDYFILCDIKDNLQILCKCNIDLVRMRKGMQQLLQENILRDGIYA